MRFHKQENALFYLALTLHSYLGCNLWILICVLFIMFRVHNVSEAHGSCLCNSQKVHVLAPSVVKV